MDSGIYTTLTRQSGLNREMQTIANNIANAGTTGFRREGVVFSEYLVANPEGESHSMAHATARVIDLSQAGLVETGNDLDFAIEGGGFFLIETPAGNRLTRAGAFTLSPEGEVVTHDGYRLLDAGAAPIAIPPGSGGLALSGDGVLSAGGQPVAQIGLWQPADPDALRHEAGTRFAADAGIEPAEGGRILQGRLEESNVDPVHEIARMITVQRAYEFGQSFLSREDERLRETIRTLGS